MIVTLERKQNTADLLEDLRKKSGKMVIFIESCSFSKKKNPHSFGRRTRWFFRAHASGRSVCFWMSTANDITRRSRTIIAYSFDDDIILGSVRFWISDGKTRSSRDLLLSPRSKTPGMAAVTRRQLARTYAEHAARTPLWYYRYY